MNANLLKYLLISLLAHAVLIAGLVFVQYKKIPEGLGGGGLGGEYVTTFIRDGIQGGNSGTNSKTSFASKKLSSKEKLEANKSLMVMPGKQSKTAIQSATDSETQIDSHADQLSAGSGGGFGGGSGGGIGSGKGPGDPRLISIWKKINHSKYYPWSARRNAWEGSPQVTFVIGEDGQITSVKITKSCGIPILDEAAVETVRRSAPLPYYPKRITLAIRFSLSD